MKKVVIEFPDDDVTPEDFINYWCEGGEQHFLVFRGEVEWNNETKEFDNNTEGAYTNSEYDFDNNKITITRGSDWTKDI